MTPTSPVPSIGLMGFHGLLLVLVSALSACGKEPKSAALEARVLALEKQVEELRQSRAAPEPLMAPESSALMKPGDPRYFVVRSDVGLLTVLLAGVEPDASGSRVTLRFGNLTSATIEGLTGRIEWGAVDPSGQLLPAVVKSREVVFGDALAGGHWTNTAIVLEGISAVDLGYVKVSGLSHRGLRLRKANYD